MKRSPLEQQIVTDIELFGGSDNESDAEVMDDDDDCDEVIQDWWD